MTDKDRTHPRSPSARSPLPSWLYFLWRFVAHPDKLASIVPSSGALGRLVAAGIRRAEDEFVLELGAGTGPITHALLASGTPAEKLIAVEIDGQLARYLRGTYPDITVIEGDALTIERHLDPAVIGKIGTVVCGLPISLFPPAQQRALAGVMFSLMPAGQRFLVYSFRLGSPVQQKEAGVVGERLAFTLRNVPPASVWAYSARSGD